MGSQAQSGNPQLQHGSHRRSLLRRSGNLVGSASSKLRGEENVSGVFGLNVIACTLIRLSNILSVQPYRQEWTAMEVA